MEEKQCNNQNMFQNFIKLQKEMQEFNNIGASVGTTILKLDDLFTFFEKHFNEFHQKDHLTVVLSYIHRCLKTWINSRDYLQNDIGIALMHFMRDHLEDENDLHVAIQIVYQILNSIRHFGSENVPISEKLFRELITTVTSIKSRSLISSFIACIQLYIEMFPNSIEILKLLWSNLKSQLEANLKSGVIRDTDNDILIQLCDEFKLINNNFNEDPVLVGTIQQLLKSDLRDYRKCGYYLLRKVLQYLMKNVSFMSAMWMTPFHIQQIEKSWIIYITILENLEEDQSHLILPSLENLGELIKSKCLQSSWMDILYMRILTHKNNLVLRWSIEFFLQTFLCSDLSVDTLKQLLHATNSNLLHNYEGYHINSYYFSSFIKTDLTNLLTLLPEIDNWKSIPLYIWLESLEDKPLTNTLTYEMILQISACVRKLQNCTIRSHAIKLCNKIFSISIEKMTMKEYVTYVETLYNSSDIYKEHEIFFIKKTSINESNLFKQRFYEIFTNFEESINLDESNWNNSELLQFLDDLPLEQHGWLKFAPFKYKISDNDKAIITKLYKFDFNSLQFYDLRNIMVIFKNSLLNSPSDDKYELIECKHAAILFYINQKSNFEKENEDLLRYILKFGIGSRSTLNNFTKLLLCNATKSIDLWYVDELWKYECKEVALLILTYVQKFHEEDVLERYELMFVKKFKTIWHSQKYIKEYTDEWFKELASKGENRIEQVFCFKRFSDECDLDFPLIYYVLVDTKFILDILKLHTDLTKRKPRYFENSNEHRVKIKYAIVIYYALNNSNINETVLNQIWNIVLNENNQPNVTYFYEIILGRYETRKEVIANKLKEVHSLTSSQQVSVISVLYNYFLSHDTTPEEQNALISTLLALTMGPNFQTRLLAQMGLYNLLKSEKFERTTSNEIIIQSINIAAGTKLDEYLNDIRLYLFKWKMNHIIILYVTNAPFDIMNIKYYSKLLENFHTCDLTLIKKCREHFLGKKKESTICKTTPNNVVNDQIQRKMNPVNDLTVSHNLTIYPRAEKSAEMFVVASLIDKIPNLGGIARSCEVLGIQNFVMDSKMHTEKCDFKNLSMTAEKTLNILEVKPKDLKGFLMNKKLEGCFIVGAEQTSNSQNFSTFKFPQKCVLLLGHEKDGIPAPLLGLLDYAVEIPQFGQVRSLNVHVTGALFMWEFCKQHLVQKE